MLLDVTFNYTQSETYCSTQCISFSKRAEIDDASYVISLKLNESAT